MKYFLLGGLLLAAAAQAQPTPRPSVSSASVASSSLLLKIPPSPRQLYPGLFEDVQRTQVYRDNKTFVDALPKGTPAEVMAAYQQQHGQAGFDLKAFVAQYFVAPAAPTDAYHSNIKAGIRAHLDTLWTVLRRPAQAEAGQYSSLLPLPHPYLVPGGRFREVYYWDSYFTMLGLREAGRTQLIGDMVANFGFLLDHYGHIPNGNRTYYLTRSQPPFFALMVQLLAQAEGPGSQALVKYRAQMRSEYTYWTAGATVLKPGVAAGRVVRMPGGEVLSRYWDDSDQPREESYREDVEAAANTRQPTPLFYRNVRAAAASGWDFSTRWFVPSQGLGSIRTTSLVPVDLNCLLLTLEQALARAAAQAGDSAEAPRFRKLAVARTAAIRRYFWNAQLGFYVDYDLPQRQPVNVRTLAGVFPLAFGVATPAQASQTAQRLESEFLRPGGLLTTPNHGKQQWDAPNAWAPLEYLSVVGLRRYQQTTLADTVAHRWVSLNVRVFNATGKLLEKYNVEDTNLLAGGGEYPLQDGFGWTNGVLLKLLNEEKAAKAAKK